MKIKKERCRWMIILDLLTVTLEEKRARKTRIMQKACLDWRNFQKYFTFLNKNDFIRLSPVEERSYEITEKGVELMNRLKEVDEMIKWNGRS